jgi:hypothetical protein
LFPDTEFFLIKRIADGGGDQTHQSNLLVIEQAGQRYTPQTYDLLLKANNIVVTAEDRERIAKAWALMTIPDYLGEAVTFTTWEINPAPRYSTLGAYDLTGWTKLGGLKLGWTFAFANKDYRLVTLGPSVLQTGLGDYLEVPGAPTAGLPFPQQNAFYFFPVR